ncbi:hypothetical protein [Sphingobium sp.]|uniref:hypothetical protein n=1 Tax=Sphingobium sp. TaxID=1912891 RepID=UPI003B3AE84D
MFRPHLDGQPVGKGAIATMLCMLGHHRADRAAIWNGGIGFSRCADCGLDMVRRPGARWTRVPRGHAVVWRRVNERPAMGDVSPEPDHAAPRNRLSGHVRRIGQMASRTIQASASPASRDFRHLARRIGDARTIVLSSHCDMATANDAMLMLAAMVQEERGGRILLIDATLTDQGIGAMLGAAGTAGLSDIMADQPWTAVEAMHLLARPDMILLGAGLHPAATRPERIATILPFLGDRFDRIIIQQRDILADSRNMTIARLADRLWILAQEGRSPMAALRAARHAFHASGMDEVELVLTAAPTGGSYDS